MIGALLLLASVARADTIDYGKLVDLTHPFEAQTICWPTEPVFTLKQETAGETPKGYYVATNVFAMAEHCGTHMDAPAHYARQGKTVEQVPLERSLIGKFIVVDVTRWAEKNAIYQARVSDFTEWEKYHGRIPEHTIVLLRTGFARFWPDREKYLGTKRRGAEALEFMRFPGVSPAAAKWLVEQRTVAALGIDTASVDYGLSRTFEAHQKLLGAGVPLFENVADMTALPETGGWLFALPMKIKGGTGAPLRLVAVLP